MRERGNTASSDTLVGAIEGSVGGSSSSSSSSTVITAGEGVRASTGATSNTSKRLSRKSSHDEPQSQSQPRTSSHQGHSLPTATPLSSTDNPDQTAATPYDSSSVMAQDSEITPLASHSNPSTDYSSHQQQHRSTQSISPHPSSHLVLREATPALEQNTVDGDMALVEYPTDRRGDAGASSDDDEEVWIWVF